MGRNLFEIEQSMMNLLDYGVDDTTGEIVGSEEEFNKLYDAISLEIDKKVDGSNCLIKTLDGEIDTISKEIKRLQALKASKEKTKTWLFNRIDSFVKRQFTDEEGNVDMARLNKFKWELPHSKISYRKSESVDIKNMALIPSMYVKVETIEKPDKTAIKEAIKNGAEIYGAELVTNVNLQIK